MKMELLRMLLVMGWCAMTLQQPTIFRSTYKGLQGVLSRTNQPGGDKHAVYYHDQTVAIVELGVDNELHDCDLIEVYEPSESMEVLKNLSTEIRPQNVSFQEMMKLIHQCELLDKLQTDVGASLPADASYNGNRPGLNPLTLLFGILPGTKWCGTGDIATNYHDLGRDAQIDRCCRSHDLCPVKVRAQRSRYNLTNYSIYTKSHCSCDEKLYNCLKTANRPTADVMGRIYFNLVKVACIEDIPKNDQTSVDPEKKFIPVKMSYR